MAAGTTLELNLLVAAHFSCYCSWFWKNMFILNTYRIENRKYNTHNFWAEVLHWRWLRSAWVSGLLFPIKLLGLLCCMKKETVEEYIQCRQLGVWTADWALGGGSPKQEDTQGHWDTTGAEDSGGRAETFVCLDCEGIKAHRIFCLGSLLGGTTLSCFCVTALQIKGFMKLWETWSDYASVVCVGSQGGHLSAHWSRTLQTTFGPSS